MQYFFYLDLETQAFLPMTIFLNIGQSQAVVVNYFVLTFNLPVQSLDQKLDDSHHFKIKVFRLNQLR